VPQAVFRAFDPLICVRRYTLWPEL